MAQCVVHPVIPDRIRCETAIVWQTVSVEENVLILPITLTSSRFGCAVRQPYFGTGGQAARGTLLIKLALAENQDAVVPPQISAPAVDRTHDVTTVYRHSVLFVDAGLHHY